MRENSFFFMTSSQLSCFNNEGDEVARITGLEISGAAIIDTKFLYVMQSTIHPIYEQYSTIDDDYILQPKQEIQRFDRAEGFMRINFESIFQHSYQEENICQATLGQNGAIRRNFTTDVISVMQSMHRM